MKREARMEYFTVAKQYRDGQEPDITIGVEQHNPFGWKGEVLIDGEEVYSTLFGKNRNCEHDHPLVDASGQHMAAVLADFLASDAEVDALEEFRERLGNWAHDVQHRHQP